MSTKGLRNVNETLTKRLWRVVQISFSFLLTCPQDAYGMSMARFESLGNVDGTSTRRLHKSRKRLPNVYITKRRQKMSVDGAPINCL